RLGRERQRQCHGSHGTSHTSYRHAKLTSPRAKRGGGLRDITGGTSNARGRAPLPKPTNVSHHDIFRHPEHCVNQIAMRRVKSGEIVAVFNEERFPFHHDSGQTLLTRSADGGVTWSQPEVVLPWSETMGNWDCGFCELADGAWLVNF